LFLGDDDPTDDCVTPKDTVNASQSQTFASHATILHSSGSMSKVNKQMTCLIQFYDNCTGYVLVVLLFTGHAHTEVLKIVDTK